MSDLYLKVQVCIFGYSMPESPYDEFLDEIEKHIAAGIIHLPNENDFLAVCRHLGFGSRREFFIGTFDVWATNANPRGLVDAFAVMDARFPDVSQMDVTLEQAKSFNEYCNLYFKVILIVMAPKIRLGIENNVDTTPLRELLTTLDNLSDDFKFLCDENIISEQSIEYFRKLLQPTENVNPITTIQVESVLSQVEFQYWLHGEEKLNELHTAFVGASLISENENFVLCHAHTKVEPEWRSKWLARQTELIYAYYLLNGNKWEGKNREPLHEILPKLFIGKDGEFTSRNLSSKYAELLPVFNDPASLPKHLKAIHALVDSLGLSK